MPFDAEKIEPRTKNKFLIEIEGLESAYASAVTIPEVELDTMEHRPSRATHAAKFASGGIVFGDIELKKVMPAQTKDDWSWVWLTQAVNPASFNHGPPASYKRDLQIHHLSGSGAIIQTWQVNGAFCKKIAYEEQPTDGTEKLIESVTIACDYYVQN